MIYIKAIIGCMIQIVFFGSLLIIPSPNWNWPEAEIFLKVFFCIQIINSIIICRFKQTAMESRLRIPITKKQSFKDKVAFLILFISMVSNIILIPIDKFYLLTFSEADHRLIYSGIVFFSIGYILSTITILQNEFASTHMEVQKEKGHILIDTGPYEFIRHPLYLSFFIFLFGMSLMLGSILASIYSLSILILSFIPRIENEERELKRDLEGYNEYCKKVKFKIIPFIY